jgi:type I restriction enzyme S subunit
VSELPQGWARATLSDLIGAGGIFSDGDWVETKDQDPEGSVRLTQLADVGDGVFRDRSSRFLRVDQAESLKCTFLEAGDVLIARMPDPLGRACVFPGLPQPAVTAVDVCIVRPGAKSVDPRWLMWTINAMPFRERVLALQTGTTRQRISRKNLATIEFPLPPLNEQRRIVAAIEEHLPRLEAAVASLALALRRIDMLKTTSLSAVVNGTWPIRPLGEVAHTTSGGTPSRKRPDYYGGGIPWVKSGELGDGRVTTTEETITELGLAESSAKIFPRGTLLIALYGATVGKLGVLEIDAATNQAVCAITPDSSVSVSYLWYVLRQKRSELVAAGQGGAQPNISQAIVRRVHVPVPPLAEQHRIVAEVEERLSQIEALRAAIERAQRRALTLRRAMLERAFRGELVVQDPSDESAAALLERIKAERAAAPPRRRRVRT